MTDQTAVITALHAKIESMLDAEAAAAALITSLSQQVRDATAKAETDGDSGALLELADLIDSRSQVLAAAIVANTPADPEAPVVSGYPDTSDSAGTVASAPAGTINPDTAPMMSGAVAPAAHAASAPQPPATEPVNTDPSVAFDPAAPLGPVGGLSPVENLPAALQPGDDAPEPVVIPAVPVFDPNARSDNPTATTAAFPDADPAANHIDADGNAVVAPPGVDPNTLAPIPVVDTVPVTVVDDHTADALPADAEPVEPVEPAADDILASAPVTPLEPASTDPVVSPPVIDPATQLPVQLDPVTNAPVVSPADAPADTSDATPAPATTDGVPNQ